MMKMSTTDTPLNTVALLKEKQQQEKTPYILLTGNKGFTYVFFIFVALQLSNKMINVAIPMMLVLKFTNLAL